MPYWLTLKILNYICKTVKKYQTQNLMKNYTCFRNIRIRLLLILSLTLNQANAQLTDSLLRTKIEQNFKLKSNGSIRYATGLSRKNIHVMKSEIPINFYLPFFSSLSQDKDSCYDLSIPSLKQEKVCISMQELELLSITDTIYRIDSLDFSNTNRETKNFYIKQLAPQTYLLYHGPEQSNYIPFHPIMGMVTYLLLYFDQHGHMHYMYKKIRFN